MGRTSTFETGLIMAAFLVITAAIGLLLFAPAMETPNISAPAPKVQRATEQEIEKTYQKLIEAINYEDDVEALRLAKWLDEQRGFEAPVTVITKIVQDWCALNGQELDFCKEENDAKE